MEILKIILESNLFNFIIMLAIIIYAAKKFDLPQKIDDSISKIKETIEKSELAKSNSIEELNEANEKTKNVQAEIKEIENIAKENLSNMKEKITQESEKQIESMKKSASKIIDSKEKEITSKLSKKTVLASFEVAKKHIIDLLEKNPDYHQNFIKESIKELNRLK